MIRVGIVGVGNCASSLVQGVEYYRDGVRETGLANPECAGYRLSDIAFSAAFDVDVGKVGTDLSAAIWAAPNNAARFTDVPLLSVPVVEGTLSGSVAAAVAEHIEVRGEADVSDMAAHLKETGTTVLVSFLPVGSQAATERYAEAALAAGCGFINCTPAVLARDEEWAARFAGAGVPLIGDDLNNQFGATMVRRALIDVLSAAGVRLRRTFQLNSGGNMDFLTMQDRSRLKTKQNSQTAGMHRGASAAQTFVGAEYVPFLADSKVAHMKLEAEAFGGTDVEIELRMNVEDSPSAAGHVLDAIRYVSRALADGRAGVLVEESRLLMKAPGAGDM